MENQKLPWLNSGGWIVAAVVAFDLSYRSSALAWTDTVYLVAMVRFCQHGTPRRAFYSGFAVGMLVAVGRLTFFWTLFSVSAIALWLVYAFWLGLFAFVGRTFLLRFQAKRWFWVLPLLWCGMEYFRSELYYLRFSWLTPAMAFGLNPSETPIGFFGSYGTGFVLMALASVAGALWDKSIIKALSAMGTGLILFYALGWVSRSASPSPPRSVLHVAGVQLEFPSEKEILVWLTQLKERYPGADLLVLSEYTFNQPPPEAIKKWCQEQKRYLMVGGTEPAEHGQFYNTAYVIAPSGGTVFRQAKRVPIQFFKDGLPAQEQRVWDSPWGKLGICICYDLSYTRVTDPLVKLGAEALIVPTMDVVDWGKRQHELHARVGPIRAAEYRLPIFRLASSGISQAIDSSGRVVASAPFPGEASMLAADLPLTGSGRLPYDRWLAVFSVVVTASLMAFIWVPRRFYAKPS